MRLDEAVAPVAEELARVESRLLAWADEESGLVAEAIAHVVRAGGKRLRPACLLLAAGLGGRPCDGAVDLAVAVEIIHTASLVHDDMIDEAPLRRGEPTLHARWGPAIALLVGDLLYSRLLSRLSENGHGDVSRVVSHTIHRMVVGQLAETVRRGDTTVTEPEYRAMVAGKTGALFACAALLGARSGGLVPEACERLERFGGCLGDAYQIVDDVLDICGDAGRLGKPVGADLRDGKLTLPVIHALRGDAGDRAAGAFATRDAVGLREAVRERGSLDYALDRAREAAREAEECLIGFPGGPHRRGLLGLVECALSRGREAASRVAPAGDLSLAAARPG